MKDMPSLQILPERVKNVLAGHPWIFSGALAQKPRVPDGGVVRVLCGSQLIGIGYYNSRTDIAVRMLTLRDEPIDAGFFAERFRTLRRRKEEWLPSRTNAYRAVFAESDGLPGLVVDKYDHTLVAQFHTLGMDRLKPLVVEGLVKAYGPKTVVERSDVAVRAMEGLEDKPVGILHGPDVQEVEIEENGFKFLVHVIEGQKTGFFLDQRDNRQALVKYAKGRTLANCFSYTGGFSVYAASVAKRVVSVDISKPATEYCRRNFRLNGHAVEEGDFLARDVFDFLKEMQPGAFDMIILDPPSFAKNKKQLTNAIKAYTTINSKALEKLPDGGILVSSSCTSHVDQGIFIKILHQSGVNARCSLKVLESREQPFDHPYHLSFPEGRYLKFFILQKWAR
ncbi:MAG TPA: class I SAM-dependent rRNA methyltransferase [Fibrobacteria bacterium]|nr:class I SAM-dependent rRNA methyltransferase [Fibrobacteria bacterium]